MTAALMIVDDDPYVARSLWRTFYGQGFPVHTAQDAASGIELLRRHEFGVVLSDRMMPGMDGIDFLEKVREAQPDTARILITGHGTLDSAMEAIGRAHLFSYLLKPWSVKELRETVAKGFRHFRLVRENSRLLGLTQAQMKELETLNLKLESVVASRTAALEDSIRQSLVMLAKAAEAKDDQTGGHVQRIQSLVESIARGLGMPGHEAEELGFAAITHDVGKIHVPDHILQKPGPLTPDEWEIMKGHTLAGEAILGESPIHRTACQIARSHHERWDGKGYPDGLEGTGIPLAARIVAVADIFDALVNPRPYKPAWPRRQALDEIRRLSGWALDPDVAAVFLREQSSLDN